MSKPVFAMLLGGILGVFDGLSALISGGPEIPSQIGTIVAGSTFKGVVAGLIVGLVARKTQSTAMIVAVGPGGRRALRLPGHDRHSVFLGNRPARIDRRPDRRLCDGEVSRGGQKFHGLKPIMPHDDR